MVEPVSESDERSERRARDRSLVALLCIVAVALVVRGAFLHEPFPSLDELWSLELSTGRGSVHLNLPVNELVPLAPMTQLGEDAPPWRAVWTSLDRVTHPPLYFLTLRGWREMFGGTDAAARALSVVASLLAIVLLYDATRLLTRSRATALWSAALMAFATPQIEHARIVRNYALLVMLGVLTWWAVARLRHSATRHTTWYAALLAASVAAMLLTHYFAVGAVAALLFYALIIGDRADRRRILLAVAVGFGVWLVTWGPTLRQHARHFAGDDSTTEFLDRDATGATRVVQTVSDLAGVPARLLVDLPQRNVPLAVIAGVACAALVVLAWRSRPRGLPLPILWLACTVGAVAVLDLMRSTIHLQAVRYTLLAAPGLYVLVAAGVCLPSRRAAWFRHLLPAILVLVCLIEFTRSMFRPPPPIDWRALAAFLDAPGCEREPVIFARNGRPDWYVGHQVMAYAHASQLPPGRPLVVLDGPAPPELVARLRESPRVWLFHMTGNPLDVDEVLPGFSATRPEIANFPSLVLELRPR